MTQAVHTDIVSNSDLVGPLSHAVLTNIVFPQWFSRAKMSHAVHTNIVFPQWFSRAQMPHALHTDIVSHSDLVGPRRHMQYTRTLFPTVV